MADEKVILDPSELATGRSQLDITPWLGPDGVDWGDATVSAYMAEAARGEVPVDYRVPNRSISGGLMFKGSIGGTTVTAARSAIQQKLSLIQREGGWLKRITPGGGTLYADLTNASFRATSWSGWESRDGIDTGSSFELEAIPDFYENETTDSDNSTTTQRELLYTTVLTDQGDSPMRARIVVDNDGSSDWRGLIWAFRGKNYPGSTAATRNTGSASMVYAASSLGTLDIAALRVGTAIYGTSTASYWSGGGTIVHHGTLSTSWTPVLDGRIGGTTYPTHEGSYQMFARMASTSGTTVQARAVWDVGDLVNPVENAAVRIPGGTVPYVMDLGEVRISNPGIGTHRWNWNIQGKGDAGSETLSVDRVWLACKDEGMGVLSAPIRVVPGMNTFAARSEFTTESGAITGDSLTVGGTWAHATNSDTDDFSVAAGVATRTATSDTGTLPLSGRAVTVSTTSHTTAVVRVDAKNGTTTTSCYQGLILRGNSTGATGMYVGMGLNSAVAVVAVAGYSSGSAVFGANYYPGGGASSTDFYTLQVTVLSTGYYLVEYGLQGSSLETIVAGQHSSLATGGVLASGRIGIWDSNTSASASTRTYDNFSLWVPDSDAVAYASQSAQLTTDGIYREDSGGTAYGPVSSVIGDLPRFPVPPQSGGTVETLLIPALGDFDDLPDTIGTASISAQNNRRPSWLFVDDT